MVPSIILHLLILNSSCCCQVFTSEKIYQIHDDMACSVAGITSDANVLINELRLIAQRYQLQYGSVETIMGGSQKSVDDAWQQLVFFYF